MRIESYSHTDSWRAFVEAANSTKSQSGCDNVVGSEVVVTDPNQPTSLAEGVRVTLKAGKYEMPLDCLVNAAAHTQFGTGQLWENPDYFKNGHRQKLNDPSSWTFETGDAEFVTQPDGSIKIHVHTPTGNSFSTVNAYIGEHTHDARGTPMPIKPSNPEISNDNWTNALGNYVFDGALLSILVSGVIAARLIRRRWKNARGQLIYAQDSAQANLFLKKEFDLVILPRRMTPGAKAIVRAELRKRGLTEKIIPKTQTYYWISQKDTKRDDGKPVKERSIVENKQKDRASRKRKPDDPDLARDQAFHDFLDRQEIRIMEEEADKTLAEQQNRTHKNSLRMRQRIEDIKTVSQPTVAEKPLFLIRRTVRGKNLKKYRK